MKTGLRFFFALGLAASLGRPALWAQPIAPTGQASEIDFPLVARRVVDDLVAGQFGRVEALYGDRLTTALPVGKLAEAWGSIEQQVGAFERVEQVETSSVQELRVAVLTCRFRSGALAIKLVFGRSGRLEGLRLLPAKPPATAWSAPTYAHPEKFVEQPITVTCARWSLPGVLTLPKGGGPFPVVVLLHGSGPHDEDETAGPNKVFKDLAWGLSSRGIAVLRYRKRTNVYGLSSADDPVRLTVKEEVIDDARAAVALASRQPSLDGHRIFLAGHSLGAYLAPRVAMDDPLVSGLILLAAPSRALTELYLEQITYLSHSDPGKVAEARATVARIESPELKPTDEITYAGAQTHGAYWLDLRAYQPVQTVRRLALPLLVLQGERDYQVSLLRDFGCWRTAFADNPRVTLHSFPGLNHQFIFGAGPGLSTPAEYGTPGHVAESVIDTIAGWVAGQAAKN